MNYTAFLIRSAYGDIMVKLAAPVPFAVVGGKPNIGIGAGHDAPARALHALLAKSPAIQSMGGIEHVPYDWDAESKLPHGSRPQYEELKKRQGLVSTGFGGSELQQDYVPGQGTVARPPAPTVGMHLDLPSDAINATVNYNMNPKFRAGIVRPHVMYGPPESIPGSSQNLGLGRNLSGLDIAMDTLAGGGGVKQFLGKLPGVAEELASGYHDLPVYHVGSLSPAVHPDTLQNLAQTPLARSNWEGLLSQYGAPRGMIANKPVAAISGSGRGDFVASRTLDLLKHLQQTGDKDTSVLAFTGGQAEPEAKIRQVLANAPAAMRDRFHVMGRVPNKDYVQMLRGPSDDPRFAHFGSSGAGQALESLLGGGKTLLPADIPAMEGRSNQVFREAGLPPDWVSSWMPQAHKGVQNDWLRRGLQLGQTPEDLMRLLRDPSALARYRAAAGPALNEVQQSQANTVGVISNLFKNLQETGGYFPHESGVFTHQTHPALFRAATPAVTADRIKRIRSILMAKM